MEDNSVHVPELDKMLTLSKELETAGFDIEAGATWIYPTNYAVREYQFSIIKEALFNNTMVSLPTGLGKTFIAAVVMYNFYRWYPRGKIIFMAPTRPLVKQQVDACYNIMAIPPDTTAELTGSKSQSLRKDIWNDKRVFFVTPQVLKNDLTILTELGTAIKCLVFDEAHKAKGNHAYCEVIRTLAPLNSYFRVLALSATPGSTLNDVLEVIHNLLISHLEIRTEESVDVIPHIHERSLETVVIPLGGKLQQIRDAYLQILEKHTRVLVQNRIITGNCSTLTKGKIFMTLKEYQAQNQNRGDRRYALITRNLNICITLYHAYELLIRHGLRGFLSFFEEHSKKPLLSGSRDILELMEDVREYLGPAPNIEPLPDGTILNIPNTSKFGHPKFYKLRDILLDHFKDSKDDSTRVIVFCEYRESVMEAHALLLQHRPLIKPKIFLGQGAISQRQQIAVISAFRAGQCNTLISTCIGEEGLDVGNVDLIICFDISSKSPVRMVQRMGRTGRKKKGRVVILVTEGKEQQTLNECLIHKQNLTNHILQSSALYKDMYKKNPRLVPNYIQPQCQKMFITIKSESKPTKKRNNKIKDMFSCVSKTNLHLPHDGNFVPENRIPARKEFWNEANLVDVQPKSNQIDYSKKIGKLRILQPTGEIGHSTSSKMLVSLLQFGESRKYNLPITQILEMPSKLSHTVKPSFKQTDIRNMFAKAPSSSSINVAPQNKGVDTLEADLNMQLLTKLNSEIISNFDAGNCKMCESLFNCSQCKSVLEFDITAIGEPDLSILDSCDAKSFELFSNYLKTETKEINSPKIRENNSNDAIKPVTPFSNIYERTFIKPNDNIGFKNTPLRHPSNIQNIFKKCGITPNLNDSLFDKVSLTQIEKQNNTFDIKHTSFEIMNADFIENKNESNTMLENLTFFKIDSLEDIFADSSEDQSQSTIIYPLPEKGKINEIGGSELKQGENVSPILCSYNDDTGNESPILCTYDKALQIKAKVQKKLFSSFTEGSNAEIHNTFHHSMKSLDKNNDPKQIMSKKDDLTLSNYKSQTCNLDTIADIAAFASLSDFGFEDGSNILNMGSSTKVEDTLANFVDESLLDILLQLKEEAHQSEPKTKKQYSILNDNGNLFKHIDVKKPENADLLEKSPVKSPEDIIDLTCSPTTSPILRSNFSQVSKMSQIMNNKPQKLITNTSPILNSNFSQVSKISQIMDKEAQELITSTSPILSSNFSQVSKMSQITNTSPILNSNLSQVNKISQIMDNKPQKLSTSISPILSSNCSLGSKTNETTEIKQHKLHLKCKFPKNSTEMKWSNSGTKCKKKEEKIPTCQSKSSLQSVDLDESFEFTFKKKTTEKYKNPPLSSSTLSILNKNSKQSSLTSKCLATFSSDSDDDFIKPMCPTANFKLPRNCLQLKKSAIADKETILSNSRIENEQSNKNKPNLRNNRKEFKQRKRKDCEYLDLEVELQLDKHATSDSDIDTDDDVYEKSFVDDGTENITNSTINYAHYLKTTRSRVNRGGFKIPQMPSCNPRINIYSQLSKEEEDTYVNDSFCVDSDEEPVPLSQSTSELDIAERILANKPTKIKMIGAKINEHSKPKRRRIIQINSDSD